MGGQLPVLDVNPKDIQNVLQQLGRMLNITGVAVVTLFIRHESGVHVARSNERVCVHRVITLDWH